MGLPLCKKLLEPSLWGPSPLYTLAIFPPSQPGELGQILSGLLQRQAGTEMSVAGASKIFMLADLENKK